MIARASASARAGRVLVPRPPRSNGSASSAGSVHSGSPSVRQISPICQRGSGLARVPLALAALDQPARGEALGQRAGQPVGQDALLRAVGGHRPLRRDHVVDRDEGRLAAHRQLQPAAGQPLVDLLADPVQVGHLSRRVGLGDPRVLDEPDHGVGERHRGLGPLGGAGDRRASTTGAGWRRAGCAPPRRTAPTSGRARSSRPRGRTTSAHACRSVKSSVGPAGPSSGSAVGSELDQVAGDEPGRQAVVPQRGDQQPGRVPAGRRSRRVSVSSGVWTPCSIRTEYPTSPAPPR